MKLRRGSKLGKYRIERRLAAGGFAVVYKALDTVQGIRVALKVAHETALVGEALAGGLRSEARLASRLDHPNILPIKDATVLDGHFVIVYPLGQCSLDDRLRRRLSTRTALDFGGQILVGLAHAHAERVIHCDIKPENVILFANGRARLSDFGIARVALRTQRGSGSGTLGYMAPEQAMGRPSFRSDVFSTALLIYRMLSGHLPEWPFEWPPPGIDRVRRAVRVELIDLLARCLSTDPKRRCADAVRMHNAFRAIRPLTKPKRRKNATTNGADWQAVRIRQFLRAFGSALPTRGTCRGCHGPIAEQMRACPWCGDDVHVFDGDTTFPLVCPRCNRGVKPDWRYCAWCFGPGFEPSSRSYSDRRYSARCTNPGCDRKDLMPFMRYCPWCRRKVQRRWGLAETKHSCRRCRDGVASEFWEYCAWCALRLEKR